VAAGSCRLLSRLSPDSRTSLRRLRAGNSVGLCLMAMAVQST